MKRANRNKWWIVLICLVMTAQCAVSRRPKLDPDSEGFYQRARFLMTKNERKIFKSLDTPELREEFIRFFWEVRDPQPLTEENEFKEEIEARFEFVSTHFREGGRPGWETDRGRIYMILGPPDRIDPNVTTEDPMLKGRIMHWFYGMTDSVDSDFSYAGVGGMFFLFVDEDGYGVYRLDLRATPLRTFDIIEQLKYNYLNHSEDRKIELDRFSFQLDFDKATRELTIQVKPDLLEFEEKDDGVMVARLNLDVMVVSQTEKLKKMSRQGEFLFKKEALLTPVAPVTMQVPLDPNGGTVVVDVVLTDLNANIKARKVLEIK